MWGAAPKSASPQRTALNQQFGEGRALPLVADMSVAESENTGVAHYPDIDILVNNMRTYALSDFFSISDEDWRRMFDGAIQRQQSDAIIGIAQPG